MKKRGQAYLIATLIIISIISGFTFLSNYTKQEKSGFIYDLKKQLEIESEKVMDYCFINEEDENVLIEHFAENFSDYVGNGVKIYFIAGKIGEMNVFYFDEIKKSITSTEENNNLNFSISNIDYSCEIKEGYNFYFVVIQEIDDEIYIQNSEECLGRSVT
jgi:hypothetical protein